MIVIVIKERYYGSPLVNKTHQNKIDLSDSFVKEKRVEWICGQKIIFRNILTLRQHLRQHVLL